MDYKEVYEAWLAIHTLMRNKRGTESIAEE